MDEPFVPEEDERFLPIVPFMPFRCPACRHAKPKTYTVRQGGGVPATRHHKCQNCGQRYKSIELKREDLKAWVERNM